MIPTTVLIILWLTLPMWMTIVYSNLRTTIGNVPDTLFEATWRGAALWLLFGGFIAIKFTFCGAV